MTLQSRFRNVIASRKQLLNSGKYLKKHLFKSNMATEQNKKNKVVIAISQICSTSDREANMRLVEDLACQAKSQAASFLFLPECCDFVAENRKQTLELSEPLTGSTVQQYREIAKRNCIWLSLGGIHESVLDDKECKTDKVYNAHVIIDDQGELVNVYRKLHLFDVNTPEFRFCESDIVSPGSGLIPPIKTPVGVMGLQICYDVRFAEASLLLTKMGAQLITFPSAFAYTTGKVHWEILLRARAIENQCFVIAPAQVGYHNKKRRSWGHAMVVDPWGKILTDCGPDQEPMVATVEIDLCQIEEIQNNMPTFDHRRKDAYSVTAYNVGIFHAEQDRLFADKTICKDTIFFESQYCFAFTNLCCVVEGHILVSTKRITKRLNGLNCEEMADLFTTVCRLQRMLEDIYKTTASTVTVQDGADAGQTVPHVHFHVMPRRKGDFGENDQIYVNLEDRCVGKLRSIEERIQEATMYRDFLIKSLEHSRNMTQ